MLSLGCFLFRVIDNNLVILDYGFLVLPAALFVLIFFLIDVIYRVANIETEKSQVDGMMFGMHDAVIAYDQDFKITLVNESLERLCNIKKEDILGKKITPE